MFPMSSLSSNSMCLCAYVSVNYVQIIANEVSLSQGTVKHIFLEWPNGDELDIFDTWVSSNHVADFNKLYKKHLKTSHA